MAPPRAVTFDVYGTLVRFHEAVEDTLTAILTEAGSSLDMQALRARFRATQGPLQQSTPWRPYKEILSRGLEMAMTEAGLPWRPAHGARLVDAIASAEFFPEVPGVLAEIQRQAKIVFISNTDEDMIARNLAHLLPLRPDLVVTAEAARAYKPAHSIFRHAFDRLGLGTDEIVHVAAGFHHDIEPAHALGLRRIWINRRHETGDAAFGPYRELPDLSEVPAALGL
jgi:2-haloacid dehalogenase